MVIYVPNTCLDLVDNTTAQKWVDAIQRQVVGDVAPEWNQSAILHYVGDSQTERPSPGDGVIPIVRVSSNDGTLGSHWLTGTNPRGEVGAQTCIDDGVVISSTLSHELIEMVADALAIVCFQVGKEIWAAELSDRVEDSDDDYKIDGVLVENWSTRAAFIEGASGPWDFRGKCKNNEVLPNGYQLKFNLSTAQWEQDTGALARPSKNKAAPSSRRASRILRAGHDPANLVLTVVTA